MIRPARESDLPDLIELARRSWLSAFAQTAPFEVIAWWARTDRTRFLYEQYWPGMHVLEQANVIVGLVQPKEAEINGLWVHPSHQRRGAGTQLLRFGENLIRRAGHKTAWLTCSAWNADALAFYRRMGYTETIRERYFHASGVELEDVRMERKLDDPSGEPKTP